MTFNFIVNNALTYRDMQLRGRQFFRGLLTFYAVCGIGAIGNVGVGEIVYDSSRMWLLAGVAGAAIGVVRNYATSAVMDSPEERRVGTSDFSTVSSGCLVCYVKNKTIIYR